MEYLKGKKAYFMAVLLGLVGALKMLTGDTSGLMEIIANADLMLEAGGLGAVRAGISKVAGVIAAQTNYNSTPNYSDD